MRDGPDLELYRPSNRPTGAMVNWRGEAESQDPG